MMIGMIIGSIRERLLKNCKPTLLITPASYNPDLFPLKGDQIYGTLYLVSFLNLNTHLTMLLVFGLSQSSGNFYDRKEGNIE